MAGIPTNMYAVEPSKAFTVPGTTFSGPIGEVAKGSLRVKVKPTHVILDGAVVWYEEGDKAGSFYHNEEYSDLWHFVYRPELVWRTGVQWDSVKPILHPSLAGMDVSKAGLDEAFVKSLGSLEAIMGGRRTDLSPLGRTMLTRHFQRGINPGALLMRAASAWITLSLNRLSGIQESDWMISGAVEQPKSLLTIEDLNGVLTAAHRNQRDWIYTRVEAQGESAMIDALHTLCSDVSPYEGPNWGIRDFWPPMDHPQVVYSAYTRISRNNRLLSPEDMLEAIERYCSIVDCHQLWQEVLAGMQAFIARPRDVGMYGGHGAMNMYYPRSDLAAGAIGVLYSGVSPQGMASTPFHCPSFHEYAYWGAVKGAFVSAGLFEELIKLHAASPVNLFLHVGSSKTLAPVASAEGAFGFWSRIGENLTGLGWNCVNRVIAGMAPRENTQAFRNMLQSHRVPWWTVVMRHIDYRKVDSLREWLVPAKFAEPPMPLKWYGFKKLGAVTNAAITASMRHTKAEVMYIIDDGESISRKLRITTPSLTRFCEPIDLEVIDEEFNAFARFRLGSDALEGYKYVQQLSKCVPHMIPIYEGETKALIKDAPSRADRYAELKAILGEPLEGEADAAAPQKEGVFRMESETKVGMTREDVDPILIDSLRRLAGTKIFPHLVDIVSGFEDTSAMMAFEGYPRAAAQLGGLLKELDPYTELIKFTPAGRKGVAGQLLNVATRALPLVPPSARESTIQKINQLSALKAVIDIDPSLELSDVPGLDATMDQTSRLALFSAGKRSVLSGRTFRDGVESILHSLQPSAGLVEPTVPTDPNMGTSSAQVFGKGLPPPGLDPFKPSIGGASSAGEPPLTVPSIGFAPPAALNVSASSVNDSGPAAVPVSESMPGEEQ